MKAVTEAAGLPTHGGKLWIFDFDGTLSPLVPKRDDAVIHPECRKLLLDLKKMPCHHVAVLSSRSLDDLCSRIPVSGIFLGGGSGTEWRTPEACRIILGGNSEQHLRRAREKLMEPLMKMSAFPGVDLEDKRWSVALHTRDAKTAHKKQLLLRLELLRRSHDLSYFLGHEVVEVQFLPEVNKAFGVRVLCRLMKFDPAEGKTFYAGDDENDAIAMRWIAGIGGTVVTVGERPLVPDTAAVGDQLSLAREVRQLAGLDVLSSGKNTERGCRTALQGRGVRHPPFSKDDPG